MFKTNDDAFTSRFLARLPREVATSFSPDQLAAIQYAFGMRYAVEHGVDVRRTVHLPWGRYYFVMLAGRDRRTEAPSRRFNPFSSWAGLITTTGLLAGAVLGLAG
ncbi:MAG: hypothetical protein JOY71_01455 [Acetobacteraceae bacterium]|nr:hypothetical protein [Acetobacteraceae bacterium]MBV8520795.1 hypothetical protein [Acetobacteraceae bacterium]